MDSIQRLKDLIILPGGKYRRGAVQAVAVALGVSWGTINNALRGRDESGKPWKLGADKAATLAGMLDKGCTFPALKPGRKAKAMPGT